MARPEHSGVQFPAAGGRRPSIPVNRDVLADALGALDPGAADSARGAQNWRRDYARHYLRLTELAADDPDGASRAAAAGLAGLARRMVWVDIAGDERPLADLLGSLPAADAQAPTSVTFTTSTVRGSGPAAPLGVPVDGALLTGERLLDELHRWEQRGLIEPGARPAVATVLDDPGRAALSGRTLVALGATSELAPVRDLLRWGATVAAVARPNAERWRGLQEFAAGTAGTLLCPTRQSTPGADLLTDLPELTGWIADLRGTLVLGNYLYADGEANLRLAAASDALATHLLGHRSDVALAFLGSPADSFLVPAADVAASARARSHAGRRARLLGLQPLYGTASGPAIADNIVPAQGPNYLLAKRTHRWRAAAARAQGHTVSFRLAPTCRTASVLSHPIAERALRGVRRYGIETFAPDTAAALLALLFIHDLTLPPSAEIGAQPTMQPTTTATAGEPDGAVHGGMWTAPWTTPSALRAAVIRSAAGDTSRTVTATAVTAPLRAARSLLGGPRPGLRRQRAHRSRRPD